MQRSAHRRLNFFDDLLAPYDARSSAPVPVAQRNTVAPPTTGGRCTNSTSSSSSASVEIVEDVKDDFPGVEMHERRPSNELYLSLKQLAEAVAEAVEDVRRLDCLIVKAIWHALKLDESQRAAASAGGPGPATSVPRPWQHSSIMSVDERRAQLRQKIPLTDLVIATASLDVSSLPSASSYPGRNTASSKLEVPWMSHPKPFLPPDRYPALLPLSTTPNSFHVNLYGAVVAANRRGLLSKSARWQHQLRQQSQGATALSRPSVSPTPSPRAAALHKVTAKARTSKLGTPHSGLETSPASTHGISSNGVDVLNSSVSLIILRVAKERALATVFLRQLRLDVYRRQSLLQNVQLRYLYYMQRRLLWNWRYAAAVRKHQKKRMVLELVLWWQMMTQRERRHREAFLTFRRGLQQRRRAYFRCQHTQQYHWFQQWVACFTRHRVQQSMNAVADAFAEQQQRQRRHYMEARAVVQLLGCGAGPSGSEVGKAVTVTRVGHRLVIYRVFLLWKFKTEQRLVHHLASWHYKQHLQKTVVRTMCHRARALLLQQHRARRSAAAVGAATSASAVLDSADEAPKVSFGGPRRALLVYVDTQPCTQASKYKRRSATRIREAALLRGTFDCWRTRYTNRLADRFLLRHVLLSTMRRWLLTLSTRVAQRAVKMAALVQWRQCLRSRQLLQDADSAFLRRRQAALFLRWRERLESRLTGQTVLKRRFLRQWWIGRAMRVAARASVTLRLRSCLLLWRERAEKRLRTRTNDYVAKTIRETVLVVGSFRRWQLKAADHRRTRLVGEVFGQLRRERLHQRCFAVWKRRAFGPHTTVPLLPPSRFSEVTQRGQ